MDYYGLFADVCAGFSEVSRKSFLIKHPTIFEISKVEKYREKKLSDLIANGAKTEKEILAILVEANLWSDKKEKELEQLKSSCKGISEGLPKIKNAKQRKQVEAALLETQEKFRKLHNEKLEYMGISAENGAEIAALEYKKHLLFYKPDKTRLFSWDKWEEMDDAELFYYNLAYKNHVELFTEYNIGNIAVQEFFKDIYSQYPIESTYLLWGNAAKDMTEYQMLLGKLARFARQYLESNRNLADEVKNDIYKMIEHNNAGVKNTQPDRSAPTITSDLQAEKLKRDSGKTSFNLVEDYRKMKGL